MALLNHSMIQLIHCLIPLLGLLFLQIHQSLDGTKKPRKRPQGDAFFNKPRTLRDVRKAFVHLVTLLQLRYSKGGGYFCTCTWWIFLFFPGNSCVHSTFRSYSFFFITERYSHALPQTSFRTHFHAQVTLSLNVLNFSTHSLTLYEIEVLSLGLGFCPQQHPDNFELTKDLNFFARNLCLKILHN